MSRARPLVLAGDVGGTKLNLALARPAGEGVEIVAEERYDSDAFHGLAAAVHDFLEQRGPTLEETSVDRACFGVAGPVVAGESMLTNLAWSLDADELEEELGIGEILFLNDLEATAYGLLGLANDQLSSIHVGRAQGPTRALIAAGTGLGAAILSEAEGWPRALPTEFGHVEFAPRDDEEMALLTHLRARYGRVSVERIVSGPGLLAIYEFLRDTGREREPPWLGERLAEADDPGPVISAAALAGEAAICQAALKRFVSAYGGAAGDLALASLALAGVYVGGGIAPLILPALRDGRFVEAFRTKGRMTDLLANVPIRVILEPRAALLGAAHRAVMAQFFRAD